MDRHSNDAPRMGTSRAWGFAIPAVLIAAVSVQPAKCQSTLRIVSAESGVQSVAVDDTQHNSPARPATNTKSTEIRVVLPSDGDGNATRSLLDATTDLWAPLSQQAATNGGEPSKETSKVRVPGPEQRPEEIRSGQHELFGRLFRSAPGIAGGQRPQRAKPVAEEVVQAPSEQLQIVPPAVDDPIAFSTDENVAGDNSVPPTDNKPDLLRRCSQ